MDKEKSISSAVSSGGTSDPKDNAVAKSEQEDNFFAESKAADSKHENKSEIGASLSFRDNEQNKILNATEFRPKTSEEKEKEYKDRKRRLIIGAIGDGIKGFSDIFFASKDAPFSSSAKPLSLTDRIYGRIKKENEIYQKNLENWEKKKEKQNKEFALLAKKNEREDVHAEYKPLKSHWNDKEYISLLYDDLLGAIEHEQKKNKNIDLSALQAALDVANQEHWNSNVFPYHKQSILYDILSGDLDELKVIDSELESEEDPRILSNLKSEFLSSFRKKWNENDEAWQKMK